MAESCPASREIEVVRELIDSLRAGEAQDPARLAEAQERGFGALMTLEAQLQRAQRVGHESTAPPATASRGDAWRHELKDAIHELARALTELRDLACPSGGPSRVGYGFVLPGRAVRPAGRPAQS